MRVRDVSGDVLTLAADLAERVLRPGYTVLAHMKGRDLAGIHYEPLYSFYPVEQNSVALALTAGGTLLALLWYLPMLRSPRDNSTTRSSQR